MRKARRAVVAVLLVLACAASGCAEDRAVTVLTLSGAIDPVSARYVLRGLDRARRDAASLVVLELDTPGGLSSSMDQIVAGILSSPVPVAVYVSPGGARAASAGVFIAMAAHVAAMAPGTHIGAAHPVDSGGGDIQGAMGQKVLNDAVANLKSLALLRGRPAAWADEAVRQSASLTDAEAVARRVADLSAGSLGELLRAVDGRRVATEKGEVTLTTAGAEVRRFRMTFVDRLLGFIVNPDLAYIFLVIGIFGLIFELTSPGAVAPGVGGAIALLIAFLGFGSLPTNVGGIVFIALAVVLFIVDIKTPTHGFLTAGGVVSFVLGSLLLFPPWRAPAVRPGALPWPPAGGGAAVHISAAAIVVMTVLVTAFFTFVLGKGIRAQSRRISFGAEALPGSAGTALTDVGAEGLVQAGGEQWSARAEAGIIRKGERVDVVGREGLRLVVRRSGSENEGGLAR
jgi:membrane-bound serine protease (ClpP class)